MAPTRWQSDATPQPPPWPLPSLGVAMRRGMHGRCPACGHTSLFHGFLRVVGGCDDCGAPLHLAPADDAPAYFTLLLVAHIVVPSVLLLQRAAAPPIWVMSAIFVPFALALALGLLRPVKGATIGVIVALNMLQHGADEA